MNHCEIQVNVRKVKSTWQHEVLFVDVGRFQRVFGGAVSSHVVLPNTAVGGARLTAGEHLLPPPPPPLCRRGCQVALAPMRTGSGKF